MEKPKIKLYKEEYFHDDMVSSIFFHFPSFEEPPEVLCTTPGSSDFQSYEEGYWTHFIEIDMNYIFEQAMGFKDYKVMVETKGEIEATVWTDDPQKAHNLVNEEDKTVRFGENCYSVGDISEVVSPDDGTRSVHDGIVDDWE